MAVIRRSAFRSGASATSTSTARSILSSTDRTKRAWYPHPKSPTDLSGEGRHLAPERARREPDAESIDGRVGAVLLVRTGAAGPLSA